MIDRSIEGDKFKSNQDLIDYCLNEQGLIKFQHEEKDYYFIMKLVRPPQHYMGIFQYIKIHNSEPNYEYTCVGLSEDGDFYQCCTKIII